MGYEGEGHPMKHPEDMTASEIAEQRAEKVEHEIELWRESQAILCVCGAWNNKASPECCKCGEPMEETL